MRISGKAGLVCASLLLTVTACTNSEAEPENAYQGAFLYSTDGNTGNSFGTLFKDEPGTLAGVKGTNPLTPLTPDFIGRLRSVHPGLNDFIYSAETYDTLAISALAAELAKTTEPKTVAKYINGVTSGGTVCRTIKSCLALARDGKDLAYRGVSLRHGFTDVGEPATASYATLHYTSGNVIDDGKTEFINAGDEGSVSKQRSPKPGPRDAHGGPLVFGSLLPLTGGLSFVKDPMLAGAKLAIKDINDAGGVLEKDVKWIDGDSGTSAPIAIAQIQAHQAAGVHVLVGPASSGVALAALDTAIQAGMILFSPCNTSAKLTSAEDAGMYFRTAPSDVLQARAITDVILRDGVAKVAIISHNSTYGTGLMADVRKELASGGIRPEDVLEMTYEVGDKGEVANPAELEEISRKLVAEQPDGILVLGYDDSADVIRALYKADMKFRR